MTRRQSREPVTLTSPRVLLTIVLGIVLAILVVPMGGPYMLLGLLVIAGLVVFDIYRQMTAHQRGVGWQARFDAQPGWVRLAIVVAGFVVVIAVLVAVNAMRTMD